jgi:hypothetical protein
VVLTHPAQQTIVPRLAQLIVWLRGHEEPSDFYEFQRHLFEDITRALRPKVTGTGALFDVLRDLKQLLTELAQINTALPAFAQRVMDNTTTPAVHLAVADRVIALGQAIRQRADDLTIIDPEPGDRQVNDEYLTLLARAVTGQLGGKVAVLSSNNFRRTPNLLGNILDQSLINLLRAWT